MLVVKDFFEFFFFIDRSWASSSNDWTAASFSLGDLEMILKDVQGLFV